MHRNLIALGEVSRQCTEKRKAKQENTFQTFNNINKSTCITLDLFKFGTQMN